MMTERVTKFLQELSDLCDKYSIYIKGCGCCGSPWLDDLKDHKTYDDLTITKEGYKIDE